MKRILAWLPRRLYAFCLILLLIGVVIVLSGAVFVGTSAGVTCSALITLLVSLIEFLLLLRLRKCFRRLTERGANIAAYLICASSFILLFCLSIVLFSRSTWDLIDIEDAAASLVGKSELTNNYFSIYHHQLFPLVLFTFIFRFSYIIHADPQAVCCLISAAIISTSFLFCYKSIRLTSGYKNALVALIMLAINPLFYVYAHYYYTDILVLPIVSISIYVMLLLNKKTVRGKRRLALSFLVGVLFVLGLKIRASVIVIFLAFFIVMLMRRKFLRHIPFALAGIIGAFLVCNILVSVIQFNYDKDKSLPPTHWVMMGLNLSSAGYFNNNDVALTNGEATYAEKVNKNLEEILSRIKNATPGQLLKHEEGKLKTTFSDGSYGYISAINKVSHDIYPIKEWISGSKRFVVVYLMQGWNCVLFFLLTVSTVRQFRRRSRQVSFLFVGSLAAFAFYLIWEVQPRYGLCFLPLMTIAAFTGFKASFRQAVIRVLPKKLCGSIKLSIVVLTLVVVALSAYHYAIRKTNVAIKTVDTFAIGKAVERVSLPEDGLIQGFSTHSKFNQLLLKYGGSDTPVKVIRVAVREKDEEIFAKDIDVSSKKDGDIITVNIPTRPANDDYSVHITGAQGAKFYIVNKGNIDMYPAGDLIGVDGKEKADLQMAVLWYGKRPIMSVLSYLIVAGIGVTVEFWAVGAIRNRDKNYVNMIK